MSRPLLNLEDLVSTVLDHVYQNNEGYSRAEFSSQDRIIEIIHDAADQLTGGGLPWDTIMEVLSDAKVTVATLLRNNSGSDLVHDAILSEVDAIVTEEAVESFNLDMLQAGEDDVQFHEQVLGRTRRAVHLRRP